MVLHNPNNWHWVNKDVTGWARAWFDENLKTVSANDGKVSAQISKITSMDGDVDVSQRKGKVITIFDVKLVLEYSGMLALLQLLHVSLLLILSPSSLHFRFDTAIIIFFTVR